MSYNLLQFAPVLCTYTFQVRAESYRNTQSKNRNGCCCDNCNMHSCSGGYLCDNRFNFCLRNYGTSHDNNVNNCPRGLTRTSVIYSNNDNFNFPSPMGGVPNPMSFSGGNWPVSIRHVDWLVWFQARPFQSSFWLPCWCDEIWDTSVCMIWGPSRSTCGSI